MRANKYGIPQFATVVAAETEFKRLTPEQRQQHFADTERCKVHGDYRCRACSYSAVGKPTDGGK